jgi:hypothetical protein
LGRKFGTFVGKKLDWDNNLNIPLTNSEYSSNELSANPSDQPIAENIVISEHSDRQPGCQI